MTNKETNQTQNLLLEFTYHAQKSIQQRGLNKEIVQFIFANGLKTKSQQDKRYIFNIKKQKQKNRELSLDPFLRSFKSKSKILHLSSMVEYWQQHIELK